MSFHKLANKSVLHDGYCQAFTIKELPLLLIQQAGIVYLIANQCGHFGVPLEDAAIDAISITCSNHLISFSLKTGEILNRPYENCDPVTTYQIIFKGEDVGIDV